MDKHKLTKDILEQAVHLDLKVGYDTAIKDWWWPTSSISPCHMRLTKPGYSSISKLVKAYKFEFEFTNTPKQLKMLAKIPVPYYVDYSGFIHIFSKDLATMISLYNDFDRYLELIQTD
jgi:hypothetical protein